MQNINALMVEVEKKVRSFQRMQGQALKNIYDRLSDFRPGGTRQLKAAFVEEAEQILRSLEQAETTAGDVPTAQLQLTPLRLQINKLLIWDVTCVQRPVCMTMLD